MCKALLYSFGCGHANLRHVSSCRGTYSDPEGVRILCNASPSYIFSFSQRCSSCLYKHFRDSWEKRLSNAQEKLSVANQMLFELQGESGDCGELGDGLGDSDGINDVFGDGDSAFQARQRLEEHLHSLREEYERDSMLYWRPFINGSSQSNKPSRHRPRKPSPRRAGSSPLCRVNTPDEYYAGAGQDGGSDCDEDSLSLMSRSPSLVSDVESAVSDASDEWVPYQPPPNLLRSRHLTVSDGLSGTSSPLVIPEPTPIGTSAKVDHEEYMLPAYDF